MRQPVVGCLVEWKHHTTSSARSEQSTVEQDWGTVTEVSDTHVTATPTSKRKPISVPRVELLQVMALAAPVAASVAAVPEPVIEHVTVTKSPKKRRTWRHMSMEEKIAQLEKQLEDETTQKNAERAKRQKLEQTVDKLRKREENQGGYRKKNAKIVAAGAALDAVSCSAADIAAAASSCVGQQFTGLLGGKVVRFKEGSSRRDKILGTVRDLAVDLQVEQNNPASSAFGSMVKVIEAMGGEVEANSRNIGGHEGTQHLMERATILMEEQVRRMAEKNTGEDDEREIRTKKWNKGVASMHADMYDTVQESWTDYVGYQIEGWTDRVDYKPAHLPAPWDVGDVAATREEIEAAKCAVMFVGVDGTSHGRNDREVLGANIGGYSGAPPKGEFAFLRENHGGVGGPRHELREILSWLEVVRKKQMLLGMFFYIYFFYKHFYRSVTKSHNRSYSS